MSRSFLVIPLLFVLACGETAAPVSELPALPAVPIATPRTGEIVVSWQDVSDNETGFRIEVSSGGGPWLLLRETAANTTSVTHPNVLHQVQYFYRIAACNDLGCSEFVETSAKWQTGAPPVVTALVVRDVRAENAQFWAYVQTGGVDTNVLFGYRKVGSQFTVQLGPLTARAVADIEGERRATLAIMDVVGLEPDTDYTVSVSAYNVLGSALTGAPIAFRTRPLDPLIYEDFQIQLLPPDIVRLNVRVDPLGLGIDVIGEIALARNNFDTPVASRTLTRPPAIGPQVLTLSFEGLERGTEYKARMILRNTNGSVTTPTRIFRAP